MAVPVLDESEFEEAVIAAIRRGDRNAFAEFAHRHEAWVRAVIFSVVGRADVVDDVAKNVWTSVWQRIGELRDSRSWRGWLQRLARNAALDAGRERSRRRNLGQRASLGAVEPRNSEGADQEIARDEERSELLAAIQSLPAIYREPFVLRHMNDWSYRQISELMGLPVDAVETRLVRARRMLREVLAGRVGQSNGTSS